MTKLKTTLLALAATTALTTFAIPAQAEDSVFVPLFTYRTGPFSNSGIPIANGMYDYLAMLNARDGGIGATTNVSTSRGPMLKSMLRIICVAARAPTVPSATPIAASISPCLTTSRRMSPRSAPNARRMPNSRVRRATVYDMTP